MIIPDKKILFVHIPKTGGQSVTKYFLENIGEKTNLKNSKYGLINNKKSKRDGPHHFHHLLLKEYLDLGLVNNIDEYFKITVVRNPYSRFISAFYFNNLDKEFSFSEVLNKLPFEDSRTDLWRMFIPQIEFIKLNGNIAIDKIFYQEKLDDMFDFFNKNYSMKGKFYANKSKIKTNHTILTKDEIKKINKIYFKDFQILRYKINEN